MPLTLLCPKMNTLLSFPTTSHAKVFANFHHFFTYRRASAVALVFGRKFCEVFLQMFADAAFVAELATVKAIYLPILFFLSYGKG